jgi:predicted nucleic acid-binding protein
MSPRRVVSNTSPISNLAIIGDLLSARYGQVVIPPAVAVELQALTHRDGNAAIQAAVNAGWLVTEPLPAGSEADRLCKSLDAGEAEAIALAAATAADVLLLDERRGRIVAREFGLNVAGVLGELLHAKLAGSVPLLKTEIERLRVDARFFISPSIESYFLKEAGE